MLGAMIRSQRGAARCRLDNGRSSVFDSARKHEAVNDVIIRSMGTQKPESWPYRLHRFFTRNLPRQETGPEKEAEPAAVDARQIWDKLTPAQQQEIGALAVRSLLGVPTLAELREQSDICGEAR
jgi:hypothetical protein